MTDGNDKALRVSDSQQITVSDLLKDENALSLLEKLTQHVETDLLMGVSVPFPPAESVALFSQLIANSPNQNPPRTQQARGRGAGSSQETTQSRLARPDVRHNRPGQAAATSPELSHSQRQGQAPQSIKTPDRMETGLDVQEKQDRLDELNQQVAACQACPLFQSRKQTVFGEGFADADLMFIGEGPGQTEDELGRPFVGKAGALLDKMIAAMGHDRSDVYIANVVKCRPPNNRTPTPIECQTCHPFLLNQIAIIQPKVIVTLGGPASKTLLGTTRGITAIRGNWGVFAGLKYLNYEVPLMPTFHPAYLLRSYTHENRAKVWSDLQQAMARLKD